MLLDFHAHYYADHPNAAVEEIVSDSFDEDIAEFEAEAARDMELAKAAAAIEEEADAGEWEPVQDDRFEGPA